MRRSSPRSLHCLQAFVYYSSSASTPVWTHAATGFTGAVAASN